METAAIVWFTVRMALTATILVAPLAVLLGWLLARKEWRGKVVVETIVTLPLVLPPVATGLVLLHLFGRQLFPGNALAAAGIDVVFTWRGVVVAMAVMALPLFVRTSRVGFERVNRRYEEIARSLGASERRVFFAVTLPLAMHGVVAGAILAFARAVGEFGATILVAGNIPGETTTLSTAIYTHVQLGRDAAALPLLLVAIGLAFAAVLGSELFLRRRWQ